MILTCFFKLIYRFGKDLHTSLTWKVVNNAFPEFKNALAMMDLIASLPATSVLCESSFSIMNLVKTGRQHRLSNSAMNDLMSIKLNGQSISSFDPQDSVETWLVNIVLDMHTSDTFF